MVKSPPAIARDERDTGSIPGSGRSSGGGGGNPLQDSGLKNPTDRGASRATACRVRHDRAHRPELSNEDFACDRGSVTVRERWIVH